MTGIIVLMVMASLLCGCQKDYTTVAFVDLDKFMGDWYVVGILPNPIEKNAANGIENYTLNPDGTISITYTYRKGGPQGKEKILRPRAKVYNRATNAEWRVQLFKPIWSPYLVIDLADDYRYTVISVPNKKYLWIMSRTPEISNEDYNSIIKRLADKGYKTEKIVKMPQLW
jgi:apolipoprotein D and lipocalin family protein